MAYDAFISYSHAADGRLAPALQDGLQRLAKPWYRVRALRVFRDETGLSTNPHLWGSIVTALDEAEWFVLLASPESARSEWVDKEIAHWLEHKPANRILPALTNGEWDWDPASGGLVGDAVPARLAVAITEEPRHLDLRWAHDETDLDLRNSGFRSAIADLAAPIHGVAKDELEGEDIRQHRRARRLARAGISTVIFLLIVAVLFGGYAVSQRNQANSQRNQANRERDRANASAAEAHQELLISESQAQLNTNRQLATLLAIEADRRQPNAGARDALLNAVLAEPALQRSFAGPTAAMGALIGHRAVLLSAVRSAQPSRDIVQVWDWQTGLRKPWPAGPSGDAAHGPVGVATTPDGRTLAILSADGHVQFYAGATLQPEGPPLTSGLGQLAPPSIVTFSANGRTLAVSGNGSVRLFSQGARGWELDPTPAGDGSVNALDVSADGSVLATASPAAGDATASDIVLTTVATGRTLFAFRAVATRSIALDWARHRLVASIEAGTATFALGDVDAFWYDLGQADPAGHPINRGLNPTGYAQIGYDATRTRLAVLGADRFGVLDATTFAPVPGAPVLHPNSNGTGGAFVLLDATRVLLAPSGSGSGPISLWDLTGTSVLATRDLQFPQGLVPTGDPDRLFTPNGDTAALVDARIRPIGAPFETGGLASVTSFCVDPRSGRIALITQSGDIVIRAGSPPFRVLSRATGVTANLDGVDWCRWRPDDRQIALGTYPQNQTPAVALYDVARQTVRDIPLRAYQLGVFSLAYSADSKTLWAGGPTTGPSGVYQITDLDGIPRVTIPFPGATVVDTDAAHRRLVVASVGSVRLYDTTTHQALTPPIDLPGGNLYGVYMSPDGHEATAVSEQGWRLVDLDAQQAIGPVFPLGLGWTTFAPDSTTVNTTGGGQVGNLGWNLAPAHVLAVACDLAGRNLTDAEWQRYLAWAGPRRATCAQYP